MKAQNEHEALEAWRRDRAEKDALIFRQLEERQVLQRDIRAQRSIAQEELLRLREDVAQYRHLDRDDQGHRRARDHDKDEEAETRRRTREQRHRRRRSFDP